MIPSAVFAAPLAACVLHVSAAHTNGERPDVHFFFTNAIFDNFFLASEECTQRCGRRVRYGFALTSPVLTRKYPGESPYLTSRLLCPVYASAPRPATSSLPPLLGSLLGDKLFLSRFTTAASKKARIPRQLESVSLTLNSQLSLDTPSLALAPSRAELFQILARFFPPAFFPR